MSIPYSAYFKPIHIFLAAGAIIGLVSLAFSTGAFACNGGGGGSSGGGGGGSGDMLQNLRDRMKQQERARNRRNIRRVYRPVRRVKPRKRRRVRPVRRPPPVAPPPIMTMVPLMPPSIGESVGPSSVPPGQNLPGTPVTRVPGAPPVVTVIPPPPPPPPWESRSIPELRAANPNNIIPGERRPPSEFIRPRVPFPTLIPGLGPPPPPLPPEAVGAINELVGHLGNSLPGNAVKIGGNIHTTLNVALSSVDMASANNADQYATAVDNYMRASAQAVGALGGAKGGAVAGTAAGGPGPGTVVGGLVGSVSGGVAAGEAYDATMSAEVKQQARDYYANHLAH